MADTIDTVVVGAGHAGLALSSCLAKKGIDHVVLERGDIAQRWRSERWDSLVFQFPNWSLQLPGYAYKGGNPDRYASKDEFIRFLETYASIIRAPVRSGTEVLALSDSKDGRSMTLETSRGIIHASNVVVATGPFQAPKIPAASRDLPPETFQIHGTRLSQPRTATAGSSSCGRQWSIGNSDRRRAPSERQEGVPRRWPLSQDTASIQRPRFYWWFEKLGYWHTPLTAMPPEAKSLRFVVTAVDGGHDVDLRQYAADGIVLAGRLKSVDGQKVEYHDDLEKTLTEGDAWYAKFKHQMVNYAKNCEPPLPSEEQDLGLRSPISKIRKESWNSTLRKKGYRQLFGLAGTPAISRGSNCLCLTRMVIPPCAWRD
jgi:putative flavoprotein involved in K+ transport